MDPQNGVTWRGRNYDPTNFEGGDIPNRCLSAATSCLYGLTEAAILAAGYAPTIGFLHTGQPLSFVYDIADLFKFETVVPVAMQIAGRAAQGKLVGDPSGEVRRGCRDAFRRTLLLEKIIPTIENILVAGELPQPKFQEETKEHD